jgi:hypothetical protein
MKCIHVNIKKIEVEKFSMKEGTDLKVFFDDGSTKCLQYSTKLENVQDDVRNIMTKITVYEKAQNKVLSDDILDTFVSVVIDSDEETADKMKNFLGRLRDDRSKLTGYGTHSGYIESLNKMQKKSIEFKDTRNE